MDAEKLGTRRRVPVSQLKPGVYVVALDRAWTQTPFLFHQKLIKNADDIELLKKHGIREVVIDTARGADVDAPEPVSAPVEKAGNLRPSEGTSETTPDHRPAAPSETSFRAFAEELERARTIHDEALAAAQGVYDGVGGGAPVNSPIARKVVTALLESITRSSEANLLLTQMRRFQNNLFTHAVNVCVLCLVVGTHEEFDNELPVLGLGALLHDVGQTRLPRNLLRQTGRYTDAERRIIEQHAELGAQIIEQSGDVPDLVRRIVIEHHERVNGSGYPSRNPGAQISLFSQVVGIIDVYDSMLTGRNRAPVQPIEVLRQLYLQSNVGAFDRDLMERIIRCLGVYPVGSLVELNTGERGIVIAANRSDTLKPTLRMILSRNGILQPNGPVINLAATERGSSERRIVRALDPGKERLNPMVYLKAIRVLPGDANGI